MLGWKLVILLKYLPEKRWVVHNSNEQKTEADTGGVL